MYNSESHKKRIKEQMREAYGRLVYSYTTHLKQAKRLIIKNKMIKYWQILLSAISTGGFISAVITNQIILTWFGGIVSTALLIVNLYYKEFNLADDISKHRAIADNLWIVREKYISLLTDFDTISEELIIQRRDELQIILADIYKTAPTTDHKSYVAAQKALKIEEEQFFNTSELDNILPEHLRSEK